MPTTVEVIQKGEDRYHLEVAKNLIENGKVVPIQIMHQAKLLLHLEKDRSAAPDYFILLGI